MVSPRTAHSFFIVETGLAISLFGLRLPPLQSIWMLSTGFFIFFLFTFGRRTLEIQKLTKEIDRIRNQGCPDSAYELTVRIEALKRLGVSGINLEGCLLSGMTLCGLHLREANLYQAELEDVNLILADLSGADLTRANLNGALLEKANLSRARLAETYLNGIRMSEAVLIGANLQNAQMEGADLTSANLIGADLTGAFLKDARLKGVHLSDHQLSGIKTLFGAELNGTLKTTVENSYAHLLEDPKGIFLKHHSDALSEYTAPRISS